MPLLRFDILSDRADNLIRWCFTGLLGPWRRPGIAKARRNAPAVVVAASILR